jgi:hypothetical protein
MDVVQSKRATRSDRELLAATARAAGHERAATADLLALLAEVDSRRSISARGYASLFTYCTQALRLSEPAAYTRITAARVARRLPRVLTALSTGDVTLTTITLLAAHLTDENHEALLEAARHKSRREVEQLVAALVPQPDIPSSVRKLPDAPPGRFETVASAPTNQRSPAPVAAAARPSSPSRPAVVPLAPERYLIRITVSRDTHAKLERARNLLRHVIPDGNPAAIVDRALTTLVSQLERARLGATSQPRGQTARRSDTRHVPEAVKRVVWSRDEGRCAFVGASGCTERGFLEFHHVVPFAESGATDADNLQLRCRAHNAYEAERWFAEVARDSAEPNRPPSTETPASES